MYQQMIEDQKLHEESQREYEDMLQNPDKYRNEWWERDEDDVYFGK
jgi:hypothetical protein